MPGAALLRTHHGEHEPRDLCWRVGMTRDDLEVITRIVNQETSLLFALVF